MSSVEEAATTHSDSATRPLAPSCWASCPPAATLVGSWQAVASAAMRAQPSVAQTWAPLVERCVTEQEQTETKKKRRSGGGTEKREKRKEKREKGVIIEREEKESERERERESEKG